MDRRVFFGVALMSLGLTGCGGSDPSAAQRIDISPRDFVVLPCGPTDAEQPCALAVAGGKRIVFGAPAGVGSTVSSEDLRQLDAVILFSLRARDIGGLDELRNESWRAGRSDPLLVIGPTGIDVVVEALNKAYEQSDALRIVEEGIPPGGYDAAVMVARTWSRDQIIFDTGDVRVRAVSGGFSTAYNQQARLDIRSCDASANASDASDMSVMSLGCDKTVADATWPLRSPLVIVRNN